MERKKGSKWRIQLTYPTSNIYLLELEVSSKYFLARCKDSLWIKLSLSVDKSPPLIPKVPLPFNSGLVMRKVQFKIKSILDASL